MERIEKTKRYAKCREDKKTETAKVVGNTQMLDLVQIISQECSPCKVIQRGQGMSTPTSGESGRDSGRRETLELYEEVLQIIKKYPQIVIPGDINGREELIYILCNIRKYLEGTLVLYRVSRQWYFNFPQDRDFCDIRPKGVKPGETADPPPDFCYNDNNWTPFTEDHDYAVNIAKGAISGREILTYYLKGAIDKSKPIAVIQKINVTPRMGIAFLFKGEIQLKGNLKANEVEKIMLSDRFDPPQRDTFKDELDRSLRSAISNANAIDESEVVLPDVETNSEEFLKIHRPDYARPEESDMVTVEMSEAEFKKWGPKKAEPE